MSTAAKMTREEWLALLKQEFPWIGDNIATIAKRYPTKEEIEYKMQFGLWTEDMRDAVEHHRQQRLGWSE